MTEYEARRLALRRLGPRLERRSVSTEFVTEALLEMRYYAALQKLFEVHFGRRVIAILKPSAQREVFLGFDQGWLQIEVPMRDLVQHLRQSIVSGQGEPVEGLFLGYFLQYKCVQRVERRSRNLPTGFGIPYYRVEISLKPNKHSSISQHETLLRLARIPRTDVHYACPMVDPEEVLYSEPDLRELRLVPVATAPGGYTTNERHFIAFRSQKDPIPVWCSEPVDGKAVSVADWLRGVAEHQLDLAGLINLLGSVTHYEPPVAFRRGEGPTLPSSLTIVQFGARIPANDAPEPTV